MIAAALALALVPGIALGLYSRVGHPDLPDMPLQARLDASPAKMDIAVAVGKIEAHIKAHPDDGRAYEVVAPVYLRLGRYDDAVHAREAAIRLLGETPKRLVELAEAMIYVSEGVISPEAEVQIDHALKLEPGNMEARYFLGLAAAQHDERDKAREIWMAMLAELPGKSALKAAVAEKLAMLDAPVEGGSPASAETPPGAAAAVAAQPQDEQQKTINAMVERLAQRLAAKGGDADEWMRLIRAYKVLNEPDKAQGALADARKALAADTAAQTKLATLAQELGLRVE